MPLILPLLSGSGKETPYTAEHLWYQLGVKPMWLGR